MADDNTKPYNAIDSVQEEAMETLASQLIELRKLIQQGTDAASDNLGERESIVTHSVLLGLKHRHYLGRAKLRGMVGLKRYKERIRACGIDVVNMEWITFDEEENEHKSDDISIFRYGGYVRKWLREKLESEAEVGTKSETTEGYGIIQEGADYEFDYGVEDDDKKDVIIKRVTRYERDLYYMFHDFLKTIRNTRDPEGKATAYQEFKDCLKWLGSGVDNQVLRCSRLILDTINKGLERVIGISRKGKEIVTDKKGRVDKIFDLFLGLIQHVGIFWFETNWPSAEEEDLDAMLQATDDCKGGFEETRLVVKEWLDTLQCRHCSRSACHP